MNEDGTLDVVHVGWGIDADGSAYYDPAGAVSGEEARLALHAGRLVLVRDAFTVTLTTELSVHEGASVVTCALQVQ